MKQVLKKLTLSAVCITIIIQTQTANADRGNVVAATIGGAIIGGLIGATIAQDFDDDDNRQSQHVWDQALRRDYRETPYSWSGNEHRGRLIFTGEGYFDGYYCRIYRSEVWNHRSDTPMITRGYVCRASDGSWFRREEADIQHARRDRPDRGPRFDRPREERREERPDNRRRQAGRQQPGGNHNGGRGGGGNGGGNGGGSSSVTWYGDAVSGTR
ncbi:hypothetical protein [Bdellovibrio sp. HCB288]|uniref:hypothetical protein n=1 Tax=Bdellovibrio sp. HCB288 TaxID=3394355 RepID=UPI0039B69D45